MPLFMLCFPESRIFRIDHYLGKEAVAYLSEAALADARVGPVFAAWDDVTIQIAPASVIALDMREADRQFFRGVLGSNPAYLLALQSCSGVRVSPLRRA
jgi:Glucose-6-phosphate dehydrogenase, NAD binding domain